MLRFSLAALAALRVFFQSRADTSLEILALRQQVAVLKRQRPRPSLHTGDRLFWSILRRFWPRWADPNSETRYRDAADLRKSRRAN